MTSLVAHFKETIHHHL